MELLAGASLGPAGCVKAQWGRRLAGRPLLRPSPAGWPRPRGRRIIRGSTFAPSMAPFHAAAMLPQTALWTMDVMTAKGPPDTL